MHKFHAYRTAAANVAKKGIEVHPEVMIPLVGYAKELEIQTDIVRRVAAEVMKKKGKGGGGKKKGMGSGGKKKDKGGEGKKKGGAGAGAGAGAVADRSTPMGPPSSSGPAPPPPLAPLAPPMAINKYKVKLLTGLVITTFTTLLV